MKGFDYFVGVDWSGDRKTWQKGLKVAVARPGNEPPVLISGHGPGGKWSRTDFAKWVCERVGERERALIGLDFAFAFPTLDHSICNAALDWEYAHAVCKDDENFYGGRFFKVEDALHSHLVNRRTNPGTDYSAKRLRATEKAAKGTKGATPQCVFNSVGPAQVGPSSISGMLFLRHLREVCPDRILIWPFNAIDETHSVIVEVFPRFFPLSHNLSSRLSEHGNLNAALVAFGSKRTPKPPESEDEGDALVTAAALRSLSENASYFALPDRQFRKEGWIFGVPLEQQTDTNLTVDQIVEIKRSLLDKEPFASDEDVRAMFERLTR